MVLLACNPGRGKVMNRDKISKPDPPPVERSFVSEMAIGDTVFIFIKQSGWSNSAHLTYKSFYTFYAKREVIRIAEKEFLVKKSFAYTPQNRFNSFELDTMMSRRKELDELTASFQYICRTKFFQASLEDDKDCNWIHDYNNAHPKAFDYLLENELTDANLLSWKEKKPSYTELDSWRKKNDDGKLWRSEMLVFWKNECKLSYTEKLETLYGQVYDY
jgi:hypothetical protein